MNNYVRKVNYYETDKMGVTHHSNYVRMMEEARVDFLEQLGWGYEKIEQLGIVSPVLSISCDFKKTTTFPDELTIAVTVAKLSAVKLTLAYTFTVNAIEVFTATSTHCFIDKDGKPVILAQKFPDFFEKLNKLQ